MFGTTCIALIPTASFSGLLVPVSSLSGAGRAHRPRLSGVLVPADQRRRLHQGARVSPSSGPTTWRSWASPSSLSAWRRSFCGNRRPEVLRKAAPHPRARLEGAQQHPRRPDPAGADGLYLQLRRLRRGDRGQDRGRSCLHRHRRRGPFRAFPADPASHPSALVPTAGRDPGDANRSVDGRRPLRVRDRDSAQVRAGRHLESLSERPDQYGCDGGRPGRQRRGLPAADHQPGGADLCHTRAQEPQRPPAERKFSQSTSPSA